MKHYLFPFSAIVGQELMKLGLILNVINPSISGILIRGEKGTGKSTVVRSLVEILPKIKVFKDDPFNFRPETEKKYYFEAKKIIGEDISSQDPEIIEREVRVIELPLGVTEDRVVGTLDIEYALKKGKKRLEPGLLAKAHRGILYVDEINLLEDHIVDILLDAAAMGINTIEREGISFTHPARFVLIGTMNPEEGELRPQLLDRFGLCVEVSGIKDHEQRLKIMERRLEFEQDPEAFLRKWEIEQQKLKDRIEKAISNYHKVKVSKEQKLEIISKCIEASVDGHRADIVILKAAMAIAAYEQRDEVTTKDIDLACKMALFHRKRRRPFDETGI